MESYLYGAAVQKIQSLIFETGKLKEIIGASELVESICTDQFQQALGKDFDPGCLIQSAAGRVIYLFNHREVFERIAATFCRDVMMEMPGIIITQAVVKIENNHPNEANFDALEKKLFLQRNHADAPHGLGLMIMERSRRTGVPAINLHTSDGKEEYLDARQITKRNYHQQQTQKLMSKILGENHDYKQAHYALEIEDLLADQERGWIAVLHADGNGLGQLIRKLDKAAASRPGISLHTLRKHFSQNLDRATRSAAAEAFRQVVAPTFEKERQTNKNAKLPIRPVLLGGDDLTLIIRGNLAIEFSQCFLHHFELFTRENFATLSNEYQLPELASGLTATAGIAFIKAKYPFHFGVSLSDQLCKYAKIQSKHLILNAQTPAPSSIMFHRVSASFIEDYGTLTARELKAEQRTSDIAASDTSAIYFNYGPYYLYHQPGYATIEQLRRWVNVVKEERAPKGPLRNWLTELEHSHDSARELMQRICALNPNYARRLELDKAIRKRENTAIPQDQQKVSHIYDVISLSSIV